MTPEEYYKGEPEEPKKGQPKLEQVWRVFCMGFESQYGRNPLLGIDLSTGTPTKLMELVGEGAKPEDIHQVGVFNGKTLKDCLLRDVGKMEMVFAKKRK